MPRKNLRPEAARYKMSYIKFMELYYRCKYLVKFALVLAFEISLKFVFRFSLPSLFFLFYFYSNLSLSITYIYRKNNIAIFISIRKASYNFTFD